MSINVLNQGLLTTIQDNGRYGYQKYGIIAGGAMDTYAMKIANILVGNDENEGVLEITMIGPTLKLDKGSLIALTGARMSPQINGKKVPMGRPIYIKEECILKFGQCVSGCRTYLSIAGGFDVKSVMESKSTYLRGAFGGKDGRALVKDDILSCGEKSEVSLKIIDKLKNNSSKKSFNCGRWYIKNFMLHKEEYVTIRVFKDRQTDYLKDESKENFYNGIFSVDVKSDRMGYRLNGPKIELKEKLEMISGEVSFGTIQLPPDGNPIILLADRATAGGYPKIAHVVSYDIQKIVQMKPGEKIKFKEISIEKAEKLYLKRAEDIEKLKKAIRLLIC